MQKPLPTIKISRHLTLSSQGVDFFWNKPVEWCTGKYTCESGRIEPQTLNQLYNISFYWPRLEKNQPLLIGDTYNNSYSKITINNQTSVRQYRTESLYDIVFSYRYSHLKLKPDNQFHQLLGYFGDPFVISPVVLLYLPIILQCFYFDTMYYFSLLQSGVVSLKSSVISMECSFLMWYDLRYVDLKDAIIA